MGSIDVKETPSDKDTVQVCVAVGGCVLLYLTVLIAHCPICWWCVLQAVVVRRDAINHADEEDARRKAVHLLELLGYSGYVLSKDGVSSQCNPPTPQKLPPNKRDATASPPNVPASKKVRLSEEGGSSKPGSSKPGSSDSVPTAKAFAIDGPIHSATNAVKATASRRSTRIAKKVNV